MALLSVLSSLLLVRLVYADPSNHNISPRSNVVPAPIVVSPSHDGNDGQWSTFTLQIGTPPQNIRVLASTAGSSTFAVLAEGCTPTDPKDCADLRGGRFTPNASSTWETNGFYELGLESNLGNADTGAFGFDTVGLDWQGSGGPVLDHQIVAGIATQEFALGLFGLSPRPINFTNFNDPQPSFIQTLYNRSLIPSLSWSYTAGAAYREDRAFGSLILGGYDQSKLGSRNLSIPFDADISRDLSVGLQKITMTIPAAGDLSLLPKSIFTFVDSTVPHIWLPADACKNFEDAFDLIWDTETELYLVDDELHNKLVTQNASLIFTIGNSTSGGAPLDIVLPYASFDHHLGFPVLSNRTRYFPLKRADNETQYTLGRTFLQEAYLTADYGRSQFFLSQRSFEPIDELILPIFSTDLGSPSSPARPEDPPPKKPLSTGATAGIAVAAVILGIATLALAAFFLRHHQRSRAEAKDSEATSSDSAGDFKNTINLPGGGKAELHAEPKLTPQRSPELGGHMVDYFKPPVYAGAPSPTLSSINANNEISPNLSAPVYEMPGEGQRSSELHSESVRRSELVGEGGNTTEMPGQGRQPLMPELSASPKSPTSPISSPGLAISATSQLSVES